MSVLNMPTALQSARKWLDHVEEFDEASDIEDANVLVEYAFEVIDMTRRGWDRVWEGAKAGKIRNYDFIGEYLVETIGRSVISITRILATVHKIASVTNGEVPRLHELTDELPAFKEWADKVIAAWPRPAMVQPTLDMENVARCRQSRALGDEGYVTNEDWLAEHDQDATHDQE